ncbi:hypothetical protein [Streptomyces sp. RFCAC02]|uniref:hypothetical protein n=1 Tax=Streptomyces sp. RFCAC02 TaxID=2499143 RepID=UPI001021C61F|nr:hypothetical protein [Streptomyces sp. RFCAC02]
MRHLRLALPALVLALGLTACGGGDDDGGDDSAAAAGEGNTQQQAILDWYACMRDNGVDMPDPDPGEMMIQLPEGSRGDPEVQAAVQACQDTLPNGGPGGGGGRTLTEEQIASLQAFTECMRENGIDMPDPDSTGRLGIPEGADPQGTEFQTAMAECQPLAAGAPMLFGGGPGSGQ